MLFADENSFIPLPRYLALQAMVKAGMINEHDLGYQYNSDKSSFSGFWDNFEEDLNNSGYKIVNDTKHGHWIVHKYDGKNMFNEPESLIYACNCSNCGRHNSSTTTPFCPYCGTQMDEENIVVE